MQRKFILLHSKIEKIEKIEWPDWGSGFFLHFKADLTGLTDSEKLDTSPDSLQFFTSLSFGGTYNQYDNCAQSSKFLYISPSDIQQIDDGKNRIDIFIINYTQNNGIKIQLLTRCYVEELHYL